MDAVFFLSAVLGLLWSIVFVLRLPLVYGCVVFLVIVSSLGHEFTRFDIGPLNLTLDRIALGLLLAAFAIRYYYGATDPKPWHTSDLVLIALLVYLTASTLWHGVQSSNAVYVSPGFRLVAGYLTPALIYFVARQSPLTEQRLVIVHKTIILLGCYLAATGFCEVLQQWSFVFPRHISDPKLGIHFGRARGPMLTAVGYGLYVSLALVALAVYRPLRGGLQHLAWLSGLALLSIGVYVSYTRSVWLGAALGVLLLACLLLHGALRHIVLVSALAAGLLVTAVKRDDLVGFKRETSAKETAESTEMRASFAYVSWLMFLERPLFGFGFGQFREAKLPYLADRETNLPLQAIRPHIHHNTFLDILAETGLLGITLFLALLGLWLRDAWYIWCDPTLPDVAHRHAAIFLAGMCVYVAQMAFHEVSFSPIQPTPTFLLAGLVTSLRYSQHHAVSESAECCSTSELAWVVSSREGALS